MFLPFLNVWIFQRIAFSNQPLHRIEFFKWTLIELDCFSVMAQKLSFIDPWAKNMTQVNWKFLLMKGSKKYLFFHLHFTWLCGSWHYKRILKKYPFWKYESCFPLSCQNWLRWGKNSICHWNIDSRKQNLSFGCVMVPKNNQNII